MKKLLSIFIFTMLTTLLSAQVYKTIDVPTAGALTTLLTAIEKTTVTNLTVTGNIDARDVKCMRDEITKLAVLDISTVSIKAYSGSAGTFTTTSYLSNKMPPYSFLNSFTSLSKTTLKTIYFPNSMTSIGEYAFYGCSGLTGNLTIPNLVNTIERASFSGCSGLTGCLTIPNSVTSLGGTSSTAFGYCTGLTSLIIGNLVTSFGDVFMGCTKLASITLGSKVNSIAYGAFGGCAAIKTINSLNPTPPTLASGSFYGVTSVTAVYVPASSVSSYKSAAGWVDYFLSAIVADNTATTYGINVQIGIGGIVKENNIAIIDGSILNVTPSTTKTFSFTPIAGYEISTLTYNGTDVKSQITYNEYTTPSVNSNATLNVTFQKIKYRLSLKDASTGTINLLCDYGARPSFDFTPSSGWKVNTVFYNSTDVTSSLINGVYIVPTITANALLNVSFVSIATGVPELINNHVKVYSTNSEIIVEGIFEGETVTLYTVNGKQIQTVISKGDRLNFPVDRDAVYLVKTEEKTYKVIL